MSTEMQDLVIGYVRGELQGENLQQFERLLQSDAELREQVAFETGLREAVKKPGPEVGAPRFEQIESRLESSWRRWLAPTAVACSLVLVLLATPFQDAFEPKFETLTTPEVIGQDLVRVTLVDPAAISALQQEYEFEVVKRFPGVATFDVVLEDNTKLRALAQTLATDSSVANVELIQSSVTNE